MSTTDQLTIRIDRGPRPAIHFNSATSLVQIYVPLDLSVNYEPIRQEIGNGYYVKVQRMQQQYKIFMQHLHEKKPEFVIFASNLAYEKEIKTTVREVNTKMPDVTIAGSNLEVSGILKGHNLTFESTVGTMHVYAKISCSGSLQVHSQNIVIATEALLMTNVFKAVCRKLQNDGKVFPVEDPGGKSEMLVELSCNLVHIGVDGSIGVSAKKPLQMAHHLKITVLGDLANYGRIQASERVDLKVIGNHISLSDGSLDSAGRGYNALKQLKRISGKSVYDPSSSSMHTAIQSQNAHVVTELIETGVDLNDKFGKKTLRQSAIKEYREAREKSNLNSVRERITLINALFVAHDWRRGTITANSISAAISRNCEDLAQFNAKTLKIKVGGVATVEKDSIFSSGWVELDSKQNVFFHGQTKIRALTLHSEANVLTTNEAILSVEQFARISCVKFDSSGMWCAGESLSLDTQGSINFKEGSYLESEKLEIDCKSNLELDGTWQLTTGWAHISHNLTMLSNSKVFIEQSASISALSLHFGGLCHVTDKLDMILQDSAHFFGSSRLEAHVLRLTCRGYCTIGGSIAVNDLLSAYVRNELITTSTGKIMVMGGADVITGNFRNDSLWQVEKNLKMTSGSLEQSEDGTIFVKYSMDITLHEECPELFGGRLIGSEIQLKSLKTCNFDGLIRCNEMQISVPYVNQSIVRLKGQVDVVAGSLTVNGNLEVSETNERNKPVEPALIIDCNLTAAAVIAPFASIHVAGNAVVRLNGIESFKRDEFNILLNCGALYTEKDSVIVSMATEKTSEHRIKCEGIICATTMVHCGQIKFSGDEVNIVTPVLVHEGRLSNVEGKANHVKTLFIHIGDLLLNNGILASDRLEIVGDGVLENTNRIYATESMDIKLRNFNNDDGLIESKNSMRLLACSKEWTKVSGSIKSRKPIDLCANRLNVAIRNAQNLSIDKRLCFSAKSDLLISSDLIDESKELSIGCAAQQSVAIDCQMQVDRFEVLIGADTLTSTFIVHQNSTILANTIQVTSNSEHVQVLFDGSVQCNRLRFTGNVKTVTVIGSGSLQAAYMILPAASISFEMYSVVRIDELQCGSFQVLNDNILRLEACDSEDITTIITDDVHIEGTLFLEKKLFVKSKKDTVRITGNILGSSVSSEFACECQKLIVKGQLGNFKFVELYARESISMQNLNIRHVEKLSIDCTDMCIYSADIENCQHVVMASDAFTSSGSIVDCGDVIIQSINIHSKMDMQNVSRLAVFGKRSATLKGKLEGVKVFEVDSKWINASCDVASGTLVKLTGWGIVNNCNLTAESITITALSVFVNNSAITSHHCHVTATFILSMTSLSVITGDQALKMCSLCLCTRNDIQSLEGVNYLWLNFDPDRNNLKLVNCSQTTMNSLKTTSNMLRDRWMTSTIDTDEILIGLKYISDLQEIKIPLNTDNKIYEGLTELCGRFDSTPISLFNFSELINMIQMVRSLIQIVPQEVQNSKKGGKKRAIGGSLYEALVQFKHGKYSKESNDSSDTDIGYVSRSSSEDLNTKAGRSRSPLICDTSTSFFEHSHLEEIEEKVSKVEEELENELKLDHIAYAIREEEELAEFEELEDELEMAEEGIIRTDFIVCREKNIYLAKLKEKMRPISAPRPTVNISIQRMPSSNDLIMKKLQVKNAISNFDLRSYGSQSSLNSLDFGLGTVPDFGSPLQFSTKSSPFQRSKIPLGSFRSPKKPMSRTSSTLSRFDSVTHIN